ncbi:DNA-binding transcriptional ArsR family regulator [Catenulispora sp. GP43]|uniref:ArsR/SmtB family transcription factor n=1 Tax=Catenulispora sp. GP43 TaxID=3156263 RepID=UPI0035110102
MTVRLVLGQQDTDRFEFGSSPGSEALRSLHVLAAVKRHPLHISWVLETRARLDARLKADLDAFRFWFAERPLVLPEIWPPGEVNTWPDDLDLLRKAPVEQFAEQMVHAALTYRGRARRMPFERFRGDTEARQRAADQIEQVHPASADVIRELISDPDGLRERFADFLAAYWDACLAADWPGLETHLHAEIERRFQTLSRLGPATMLAGFSEHITAADDGSVTIRPPGARGVADPLNVTLSGGDRVLLVPSHFMWPELAVAVHRDRARDRSETTTVVLAYALAGMARQGRAPVPAEDLLALLRGAGDTTRLQILELLARRSRSTRELAGLIGLTEAAVSKHLKVLHKSGWIAPERHSYYVYYRLEPDARDRVVSGLDRALGR